MIKRAPPIGLSSGSNKKGGQRPAKKEMNPIAQAISITRTRFRPGAHQFRICTTK